MSTTVRALVNPRAIHGLSSAAIATTILLAIGWLGAAAYSFDVTSRHLAHPPVVEDMTIYLSIMFSLGLWAGFLGAGTVWALWQRSVARVAVSGGVRDPDWHAEAWFSPIVMWWEPLRNMRELSTYLLPPQQRWLVPAWWASWVAFRGSALLVVWQLWAPSSRLLPPASVGIAAAIATIASTVFAVMLIERVTVGAMTRGRVPYVINYVKRPYPFSFALFVVGIVCRAATPIGVVLLLTELWGQFP